MACFLSSASGSSVLEEVGKPKGRSNVTLSAGHVRLHLPSLSALLLIPEPSNGQGGSPETWQLAQTLC